MAIFTVEHWADANGYCLNAVDESGDFAGAISRDMVWADRKLVRVLTVAASSGSNAAHKAWDWMFRGLTQEWLQDECAEPFQGEDYMKIN